jgi:hypothetical protein
MLKEMITVPVQISAVDFWSNILGSSWESMEWWVSVEYDSDSDWDKVGSLTITAIEGLESDEETSITKTITLDSLVEAYANCVAQGFNFNVEDFDAFQGDAIIQMAVFGEVVYG